MHYYSLEIVLNQVLIIVFVRVMPNFRMFQGQNFSGTYKPTRKTRIQYFAIQIIKPTAFSLSWFSFNYIVQS